MKRMIVAILGVVLVGTLFGTVLRKKEEAYDSLQEENLVYFLSLGNFATQEEAEQKSDAYAAKMILKEDGKYDVYVGLTQDEENLDKIKSVFSIEKLIVREMCINNDEFLSELKQYDILLKNTEVKEEIVSILKSVFSTYEETVNEKT